MLKPINRLPETEKPSIKKAPAFGVKGARLL
jgi:hypothetical protein